MRNSCDINILDDDSWRNIVLCAFRRLGLARIAYQSPIFDGDLSEEIGFVATVKCAGPITKAIVKRMFRSNGSFQQCEAFKL